MPNLKTYLKLVFQEWLGWLGLASSVLWFVSLFIELPNFPVPRIALAVASALLIFFATFRVWQRERLQVMAMSESPVKYEITRSQLTEVSFEDDLAFLRVERERAKQEILEISNTIGKAHWVRLSGHPTEADWKKYLEELSEFDARLSKARETAVGIRRLETEIENTGHEMDENIHLIMKAPQHITFLTKYDIEKMKPGRPDRPRSLFENLTMLPDVSFLRPPTGSYTSFKRGQEISEKLIDVEFSRLLVNEPVEIIYGGIYIASSTSFDGLEIEIEVRSRKLKKPMTLLVKNFSIQ